MTRYRWRCGRRRGRWRPTREEARAAAVKAGLGSYDAELGVTFLDELVEIEEDRQA